MTWQEELKMHLQKLGDFWVDKNMDRYQVIKDKEKQAIGRKKDSLKERKIKIVKANVSGKILSMRTLADERTVEYRYYLSLLQKQMDTHFHIEETWGKRRATFKNDRLILDEDLNDESTLFQPKGSQILVDSELEVLAGDDRSPSKKKGKSFFYDRIKVVRYADRWWNSNNPEFKAFDVDCTNYVSQCLYAGGIPMDGRYNQQTGWWFSNNRWSLSWAVAHSFRWYLASDRNIMGAVAVDTPEKLQPGDVICYDFEGDGHWDHSTIVTDKDGQGMPLVNAHTTNSRHRYWAYEDSSAWTQNIRYKFYHIED